MLAFAIKRKKKKERGGEKEEEMHKGEYSKSKRARLCNEAHP